MSEGQRGKSRFGESVSESPTPTEVTIDEYPISVNDDTIGWTRQLLALRLMGDEEMLQAEIRKLCSFPRTAARSVVLALVTALAATWDSLEDFSAHLVAVDLKAATEDSCVHGLDWGECEECA